MATDTRYQCLNSAAFLTSLAVLCGLAGCERGAEGLTRVRAAAASATPAASSPVQYERDGITPKRYSVVPYGYNYTDTYIDSFEVNSSGGGNLEVSIPTAGGGGSVCCMPLVSGLPSNYPMTVKWTRSIYSKRWCEQTVYLTKPIPPDPHYLEVHFYQDGHIEVEATQEASSPRLKLDRASYARRHETGNVNNDEKFSRCKDGY